jgi:signal transduction histidine kinase
VNKGIAQVIAEKHQGKITVESKLDQGATFCVNKKSLQPMAALGLQRARGQKKG